MSETKLIDIKELKFDEHNFNRHNDEGMSLLEKSIKENGLGRSILLDKDNNIVGGNGVTEKAIELGKTKVRIIETDGTELIAVKRTDLTLDSEQGRKMALADNSVAHANLQWNEDELKKAQDEWGLVPEEWGVELPDLQLLEEDDNSFEDEFDEQEDSVEPVCKDGDLWKLGEHRLLCGDSTNAEVVARLLDGVVPDMVFTDPPYGINLNGDNSKRGSSSSIMKGGLKLKSFVDDSTIYACKAFDIVQDLGVKKQVWFGANYYCHHLPETNNWLIWDKRVEEKMNNTNSDCELAWVLDGHSSCRIFRYLWNGLIKAGEKGEKRVHPTQKPIALIDYCVKRYAPEAKTILDLFGGSGTTLIACEQLGRKCRMMELDPHYCDVIIARWEKLTGNKAEKMVN